MKRLVAVLVIIGLLAAGMLVLTGSRASAATTRYGGWADQLIWTKQPDGSIATQQMDAGTMNMWTYYYSTQTQLSAAQTDSNLGLITVPGSIEDLLFNPVPFNQTAAATIFNPFSITEVRTAMNYLFDRSYMAREIYGGAAFPQTAVESSQTPDYARDPAFFAALEAQYTYNFQTAKAMVTQGLTGVSDVAFTNGQWTYKGTQINLNIVVRSEDQRRQIGDYATSQLTALGFHVTEIVTVAANAYNIVYYGDPTGGAWNVYTEGFGATALTAWADSDPYYYYCGGQDEAFMYTAGPPWGIYRPPQTLLDACNKLLYAQYTSVADRQTAFETAATLGLEQGVRVFLLAGATFPYAKKTIVPPVYDLAGGLWSFYSTRSAQLIDSSGNPIVGGRLIVGNKAQFVSDWNPWAQSGFSFLYDVMPFFDFTDYGVWLNPDTGLYIPIRENFTVTTAGPGGSLSVPSTAYFYNASKLGTGYNNTWGHVGSGVTATSEVIFEYTFAPWHDNATMNMNDILYSVASVFRRTGAPAVTNRGAGGDLFAKDPQGSTYGAQLFAQDFRGLQVLDSTHLAIYINYWHVDPTVIASVADVWPSTSWDESELAFATVLHNNAKFDSTNAKTAGVTAVDLTKGNTMTLMAAELANNVTTSGTGVTVPPGFGASSPFPISQNEATTRWADLAAWKTATGTYYSSNGPYQLARIDLTGNQIVMYNNPAYPYTADHWSQFEKPKIPTATVAGPSQVLIGLPASFNLTTALFGTPYDDVTAVFLVLNPATSTVLYSGPVVHTGVGTWAVNMTPAQTTTLAPGAYTVETVTVGGEAAVPVFSTTSFTAISQLDYVLLQVGLALGNANSRISGLQNSLNSTNSQLTSAQNTINSLSGLLYASIAVAVVAVVIAALSVVLLFRRIPKVGGKGGAPETEESEPPKGPEEL